MDEKCTIYRTADFIGKKWTLVILLEIYRGQRTKKRYSEIKKNLPSITPKMLSSRLKELEKEEMIKKEVDTSKFPVKSEYSLTESGREFISIIQGMKKWALKWKIDNRICERARCKNCMI